MGFTVESKHVLLCGLVTLMLTCAAFHDKLLPHGDTVVSVQGRKGLSHQVDDVVVATQGVTVEAEEAATGVVTEDAAGEVHEEKAAARELEEEAPPVVGDVGDEVEVIIPEPLFSATSFLQQIRQDNADAVKKEDAIQDCIAEDGCGTP